jgi:hypothetical protein
MLKKVVCNVTSRLSKVKTTDPQFDSTVSPGKSFWTSTQLCGKSELLITRDCSAKKIHKRNIQIHAWDTRACPSVTTWQLTDGHKIKSELTCLQKSTSRLLKKWTSWPLRMGPICCPETSVKDYHSTLRYTPEERKSHQHRGGSLKSLKVRVFYIFNLQFAFKSLFSV